MNKLLILKIIFTIILITFFFTENIFGISKKYIIALTTLLYFVLEHIIRKNEKKNK